MIRWLILLITISCSSLSQQAFVEHFKGEVQIYKPNNQTLLGRYPILVRRTVDPEAGEIMEELWQPDFKKKSLKEIVTNFEMQNEKGLFKIHDSQNSFKGKVRFSGTPWGWEEWQYVIRLNNGQTIRGFGQFEDKYMLTIKYLFDAKGKKNFILKERLEEIDAVQYKHERAKLNRLSRSRT